MYYAFRIYRDLLFPYWQALKDKNPGKEIFIQEDNATPHTKARKLLQGEIAQRAIRFFKYPANSPDIASIETLQWEHQRRIQRFIFSVTNKQKGTRDQAIQVMKDAWQSQDLDDHNDNLPCLQRWELMERTRSRLIIFPGQQSMRRNPTRPPLTAASGHRAIGCTGFQRRRVPNSVSITDFCWPS